MEGVGCEYMGVVGGWGRRDAARIAAHACRRDREIGAWLCAWLKRTFGQE